MMHRHSSRSRSRARELLESRQPQEDGRQQWPAAPGNTTTTTATTNNNVPRSPQPTTSHPTTPHSAPPPSHNSPFTKTRCYRLNLEKPFDIRQCKSPLGRDYTGPPVNESDLPPAQGPVEYIPPLHLCSREENTYHRHSWGGGNNNPSTLYGSTCGTNNSSAMMMIHPPSDLLENLHVSHSDESDRNDVDPTSIAISTANIFRGIVVDRNGVITSMNSRAMRSMKGKNGAAAGGGGESGAKVKIGEKSRQAAKIDKAKDLIDEVVENGGVGGGGDAMSDEDNDPTKTVSLIVMGEYEDLNDLVRDGSKKLRNSKSLSDEAILMYNRPRQSYPPNLHYHQQHPHPHNMGNKMALGSGNSQYSNTVNTSDVMMYGSAEPTMMSPTNTSSSGVSGGGGGIRKFICNPTEKSHSKQAVAIPPKLKSNPRDTRSSIGSSSRNGRRASSTNNNSSSPNTSYHYGCNPLGGSSHVMHSDNKSQSSQHQQQQQQQQAYPNYFQQQCNFFPGNSDWTEALGFSVNSLWNCGANGANLSPTMSPNSNPSSPRNGGGSGGQGAPAPTTVCGGVMYHHQSSSQQQQSGYHSTTTHSGYHHPHHQHPSSSSAGYQHRPSSIATNGAGYGGSNTAGGGYNYNSTYRNEERNPSYGYGNRGGNSPGVRDTVVM